VNRYSFPNPFIRNHCVPLAFAHVGLAYAAIVGDDKRNAYVRDRTAAAKRLRILSPAGVAFNTLANAEKWALVFGLVVAKVVRYIRAYPGEQRTGGGYCTPRRHLMTLATFARRHPSGTYVVRVTGHAVALIDGVLYGYYRPRSIVNGYVKLEAEDL